MCRNYIKSKGRKRERFLPVYCFLISAYTARVTLPERKQRVQAYTLRGEPFTTAFTRFTLGFQVLFERL
jgi:hypothetical protein